MTIAFDTSAAITLGAASVNVDLPGFTTATDNELLLALFAGADNVTATTFSTTVSPPASTAGTTASTCPPSPYLWHEVLDSSTVLGADTCNAVEHAVKATAGDTGTFQLVASGSAARHVLIAAAFKFVGGGLTLSNPAMQNITTTSMQPKVDYSYA